MLLADRGFADGKLMKYLRQTLAWHFRIRIKRSFQFYCQGQWHKVSVDPHWQRGMSYFKLGWNWIRLAITHQWHIQPLRFLSSLPDPQPAIASKRQLERSFERQFVVLSRFPAS